MLKKIVIAAAAMAALGTDVSFAATASVLINNQGSLNVSGSVQSSCSYSVTSSVQFPTVVTANTAYPAAQNGTVVVTCDNGVDYALGLGNGQNSITNTGRKMSGNFGSSFLPYHLYTDVGLTTEFSDVTNTSNVGSSAAAGTVGGTGTGSGVPITIYGLIPAGSKPAPGNYNDNVVVTVGY